MRAMVAAGNTRFCRSYEVFFKGIIHMLIMNSELVFKITCWSNLFLQVIITIIDRIKAREQTFTIRTIKLGIHVQQHVWSREQIEFWQSSQWSYLLSSLMTITLGGSIHRNLWIFFFSCASPRVLVKLIFCRAAWTFPCEYRVEIYSAFLFTKNKLLLCHFPFPGGSRMHWGTVGCKKI